MTEMGGKCGLCKGKGVIGAVSPAGKVVRMTCTRCGGSGRK